MVLPGDVRAADLDLHLVACEELVQRPVAEDGPSQAGDHVGGIPERPSADADRGAPVVALHDGLDDRADLVGLAVTVELRCTEPLLDLAAELLVHPGG